MTTLPVGASLDVGGNDPRAPRPGRTIHRKGKPYAHSLSLSLAAIAALSLGGVAAAQTAPASHMTPVAKPAPASTMAVAPKPMATTKTTTATTATTMTTDKASLSKSCSDQANGKNLHGKERKKFRNACKHGKA